MTRQPTKVLQQPRADQIEFDAFYRQHWSALVRLAWTLTGRRALAEEIAQDAMLSAHRQWSRVRLYDRPDLWVRRATINRCTSAFRRASREARLLLRVGSRLREGDPPTEPLPEIWRDVARLPRRQAQVVAIPGRPIGIRHRRGAGNGRRDRANAFAPGARDVGTTP